MSNYEAVIGLEVHVELKTRPRYFVAVPQNLALNLIPMFVLSALAYQVAPSF